MKNSGDYNIMLISCMQKNMDDVNNSGGHRIILLDLSGRLMYEHRYVLHHERLWLEETQAPSLIGCHT